MITYVDYDPAKDPFRRIEQLVAVETAPWSHAIATLREQWDVGTVRAYTAIRRITGSCQHFVAKTGIDYASMLVEMLHHDELMETEILPQCVQEQASFISTGATWSCGDLHLVVDQPILDPVRHVQLAFWYRFAVTVQPDLGLALRAFSGQQQNGCLGVLQQGLDQAGIARTVVAGNAIELFRAHLSPA